MSSYRKTEQDVLIELLSTSTADYTKLLTGNGDRQQLDNLHREITAIQKEINFREKLKKYPDLSTEYITSNDSDIV